MKKFDITKECCVRTAHDEFHCAFTYEWTNKEIESWMLDTYCIDKESVVEIEISTITKYKYGKD